MVSAYALDFLKHKITTSAKLYFFKNLGLNLNTSYNVRNGSYEDVNKQTINYKPYILADLRLFYEIKKSQIYLDANNLLNNKYSDLGGIEQAGLWIKGGIKVNLNL
jgi:iron complex outermembrane receptor protein